MIQKVVSGGQTGVDRAALDAAMERGIQVGGWCPAGRKAEDGTIDSRYPLRETPADAYSQRTAWNVRDSDGTLILVRSNPIGGTQLTGEEAKARNRPCLMLSLGDSASRDVLYGELLEWLKAQEIRVLNIAGPRESEELGIYELANAFLGGFFDMMIQRKPT